MAHTHVTTPTQFIDGKGVRFAYRRFGKEIGVPLLFIQHFRGGLDHWDPAITDGLGKDRPVILFNNAGVASSSGETPDTVDAMAQHARDFVAAVPQHAGKEAEIERIVKRYATEIYRTDPPSNLGRFDPERLRKVQKFYIDNDIIQTAVPIEELYTNAFVV